MQDNNKPFYFFGVQFKQLSQYALLTQVRSQSDSI